MMRWLTLNDVLSLYVKLRSSIAKSIAILFSPSIAIVIVILFASIASNPALQLQPHCTVEMFVVMY